MTLPVLLVRHHPYLRSDRYDLNVRDYITFISNEKLSEERWGREIFKYYKRVVVHSFRAQKDWVDWIECGDFNSSYYKYHFLNILD